MTMSGSSAYPKSLYRLNQLQRPILVHLCEKFNLSTKGFKQVLARQIWVHLDQHMKPGISEQKLCEKVETLIDASRIATFQRKFTDRTVEYPSILHNFPMFDETMGTLVEGGSLDTGRNSVQVVRFNITPDQIERISVLDKTWKIDLALVFWCVDVDEPWEPLDIGVTVNNVFAPPHKPGDHIYFIRQYAIMGKKDGHNEILIAGDNDKLKNWALRICFCKIRSVDDGLVYFAAKGVGEERTLTLAKEAFNKYPTLKFKLKYTDPKNPEEVIQNPSRSTRCDHLRVFDLKKLLEEQRNKFVYTCPLCDKDFMFWETEPDNYARRHTENGHLGLDVYNIKDNPIESDDDDCHVLEDIITLN